MLRAYSCAAFIVSLLICHTFPCASQTLEHELVTAVRQCDYSRVRALLAKGADVNTKDRNRVSSRSPEGETVLAATIGSVYWADTVKCTAMAQLLIANGADVSVRDRWGWPLVTWAALIGNAPIVDALLTKGVAADARTDNDTLAVPVTVKRDSEYRIVYWRPHLGATALMYGVESGNIDTVKALLAHGADANAKDQESSKTVLMYAMEKGDKRIIRLITEAASRPAR